MPGRHWHILGALWQCSLVPNHSQGLNWELTVHHSTKLMKAVLTGSWSAIWCIVSRPVLPNRELAKGGSAITSGCQQRARAMKLQYVAWWWWSRERKPTGFGSGFGCCLASVSTSQRGSEKNPKGSGSGTRSRRDRDTGSILVDYQTEELETSVQLLILRAERENVLGQIIIGDRMYGEERSM